MGGEGSILGMITSLRNNQKLLRKNRYFERKNGAFDDPDKTTFTVIHHELEIQHLTKEELKVFHDRTIRANRKNFLKRILLASVFLIILGLLGLFVSNEIGNSIQLKKQEETIRRIESYNNLVQKGDTYSDMHRWAEAIFSYKRALLLFPAEKATQYKLLTVYLEYCIKSGYYCSEGKEFAEQLVSEFPDDLVISDFLEEFRLNSN